MDTTVTLPAGAVPNASLSIEHGLLERAKNNDVDAIAKIFQQFMSPDEEIYFAEYCGVRGIWIFGTHCFACLTNRRLAALQIGSFGKLLYTDGYLEHANSGVIHQPSLLKLVLWCVVSAVVALGVFFSAFGGAVDALRTQGGVVGLLLAVLLIAVGLGLGLAVFVSAMKVYHRIEKCGLVWWIREGIGVYVFTDRSKLTRANHLYRLCCQLRDERIKQVGHA
jgi:hypothetical protein